MERHKTYQKDELYTMYMNAYKHAMKLAINSSWTITNRNMYKQLLHYYLQMYD